MTPSDGTTPSTSKHDWDADRYRGFMQLALTYASENMELLSLQPGQRVLDVGCGEGRLSLELVARGFDVLGIDPDPDQIRLAQASGLNAQMLDAHDMVFENEFDGVYSNWAIHWIADRPGLFKKIARALKPGGQFVAEHSADALGGHVYMKVLTEFLREDGIDRREIMPFHTDTPDELLAMLQRAGFQVPDYRLVRQRTILPDSFKNFVEVIFSPIPRAFGPRRWPEVAAEVERHLAPDHLLPDGRWTICYVRHRYLAIKP